MGAMPKMPIIMAMRMMMPEKILFIPLLVTLAIKLPQPENLVKKKNEQKNEPAKFIGSFLEKLQKMVRKDGSTHRPPLPTFTFRQVGVKAIQFKALPGPEARALREKIMRHASFLGPGGLAILSPRTG
jgi:hypothetical protein